MTSSPYAKITMSSGINSSKMRTIKNMSYQNSRCRYCNFTTTNNADFQNHQSICVYGNYFAKYGHDLSHTKLQKIIMCMDPLKLISNFNDDVSRSELMDYIQKMINMTRRGTIFNNYLISIEQILYQCNTTTLDVNLRMNIVREISKVDLNKIYNVREIYVRWKRQYNTQGIFV